MILKYNIKKKNKFFKLKYTSLILHTFHICNYGNIFSIPFYILDASQCILCDSLRMAQLGWNMSDFN